MTQALDFRIISDYFGLFHQIGDAALDSGADTLQDYIGEKITGGD